jgi:hypothetical protein
VKREERKLTAWGLVAFLVAVCLSATVFLATPTRAKPAYMDRYNRDARAKQELKNKCTVCHVGRGGDTRNAFGEAFEDAGYRITPKLREKFPKLFVQESHEETPEMPEHR